MVVFRFNRERVRAVAFDLVAQRTDHLRMTGVAAFADVDVPARQFERRVDTHVGRVFHRLMNGEEGRDFPEAAYARCENDAERESDGFAFQPIVQSEHAAYSPD